MKTQDSINVLNQDAIILIGKQIDLINDELKKKSNKRVKKSK